MIVFDELQTLLRQVWDHHLTMFLIALVLVVGVGASVGMWRKSRRAIALLRGLGTSLASPDTSEPAAAIWRAKIKQLDDGRSVLTERPEKILVEWLGLNVLRLARFEAGAWITGLALFCTFFLIALVLASEVGPAIGGADGTTMTSLARAVQTMGAKFVVSMVGIALSILHGFLRARCVRELHAAAEEAAQKLRRATISIRDFQMECADKQLKCTVALEQVLRTQHTENAKSFDSIRQSIESLKSIEVSVKDIGATVADQLEKTVKNDIVAAIGRDLKDIVDELEKSLSQSFAKTLDAQVTVIAEELRKIETAVAGQARSQVEDLLTKLGDLVSGGFSSESSRMKDALSRFAEVIPSLEAQMRAMTRTASDDLAQRTAEASRANAQLFDRLGSMLDSMERQHREVAETSAQMQQVVAQAQTAMAGSLAAANEQFSAKSQSALNQMTEAMRSATENAAGVYRSLVSEVEAAAKTLHQARTEAAAGTTHLRDASELLREPLRRMSDLLSGLRETVSNLSSSVEQAKITVDGGAAVVKSSTESVAQHQRFVEELTSRWPTLARQYIEDSDRAFAKVAAGWRTQAESIGNMVSLISSNFAGSATDFATAVEELGEHVSKLAGGRNDRTPPPPPPARTRG